MKNKKQFIEILKTITLVLCIILVGLVISACQSSLELQKVNLPSTDIGSFAYPTKDPSIEEGKKIFAQNCASCHSFKGETGKHNFTPKYVNSVTPSKLFKAITSDDKHPSFRDKLSIKERWDAVMYLRFVLFGYPEDYEDIKIKFGSNCAVCHGTRGFGDGDIHYFLNPPPANFNQFERLYEKTDETLFEEISNGIPWTAMPPWKGRIDKDKHFQFDDKFRWELVKYVRHFGYTTERDVLRDKKLFEKQEIK